MIGQLESVLQNKDVQHEGTSQIQKLKKEQNNELNKNKFFSIKEIIKLNVDEGSRYNRLQRDAMTPED